MKKIFIITIVIVIIILIISCQKDLIESNTESDIPVVEALLYPGHIPMVKLSRLITFSEEAEEEGEEILSGQEIYLEYNGLDYLLKESESAGMYVPESDSLIVLSENSYGLSFVYNGDTVNSETWVPSKPVGFTTSSNQIYFERIEEGSSTLPTFESVDVEWDNPDNSYHLLAVEYLEDEPDYINYSFADLDISLNTSTDPVIVPGHTLNGRNLYCFGTYRIVLLKVNQEYADLYESISQSSNNLTSPLTNINNGWGIFTGVNSDTLYLEVKEL